MILVDANLLIYAHVSSLPQHAAARRWLDAQLSGSGRVGLPWASLVAFVRLVTNPRVFERAEPVEAAWQQVERWLDAPPAWVPLPTERHRAVLADLLRAPGAQGDVVADAHLAALAVEHGLAVCSTDGDFGRFAAVRWINPLAAGQARPMLAEAGVALLKA